MKLTDLEPQFIILKEGNLFQYVEDIDISQGIIFICPSCGNHSILVWFSNRSVPETMTPKPRWNATGNNYEDLTFVGPGATSILLYGPCKAHFLVENGEIKFC